MFKNNKFDLLKLLIQDQQLGSIHSHIVHSISYSMVDHFDIGLINSLVSFVMVV